MIDKLYDIVERQYFDSRDFNGMPIYRLESEFDIHSTEFRSMVRKAIEDDILTARFHTNPHIRAFSDIPKEQILEWFNTLEYPGHTVLYPHSERLKNSSKLIEYEDAPYELEMAKGAGQLDYRTFDLSVLEYYRNDPRYFYKTDFIRGQISIEDEYFESEDVPEHDQILLESFGFAYDGDMNRFVAVFLRYLADLSAEHQKVWNAKEIKGDIRLHPDYYASCIQGKFGSRIPIFRAFVEELEIINEMCSIMNKPPLFRHSYHDERPKEFGFLLRPTANEFNNFMLLLDKMMSDNINKKFFKDDIPLESEKQRDDGKIVVQEMGTIQLLDNWINKYFRPVDPQPTIDMIKTFKDVRKLRQKPAHKVNPDTFDQKIFKEQRDIVMRSFDAVRTIRLILTNHPLVKSNPPQISQMLFDGKIWTY